MLYPATRNLPDILIGATYDINPWTWKYNGTAVPLTSCTAELVIEDNNVTVLTLTSGSGITLGGTAGTITISISATATGALTATQSAVYRLKITLSDSTTVRYIATGRVNIVEVLP